MCVACDQLHATLKPSFLKLGTCVKAEFLGLLALPNSGFEIGAFFNVNGLHTRESVVQSINCVCEPWKTIMNFLSWNICQRVYEFV